MYCKTKMGNERNLASNSKSETYAGGLTPIAGAIALLQFMEVGQKPTLRNNVPPACGWPCQHSLAVR